MTALGGDDSFEGKPGNDQIHGNGGDDFLQGGGDEDLVWGDSGDDAICGNGNHDLVLDWQHANDFDHLSDGEGSDEIYMDDGDPNDHWHNQPDGVGEIVIAKDPNDTIVNNSTCHS